MSLDCGYLWPFLDLGGQSFEIPLLEYTLAMIEILLSRPQVQTYILRQPPLSDSLT
jgi:hypothetical protein